MRLFHLLASHDPARPTGVNRFSGYFRRAFPEVFNITPGTVAAVEFRDDDVIVTDNHLSLLCPDNCRVVVVHHGCASTHFERDVAWRNAETEKMVADQRAMFDRPNRTFVAPSGWIGAQFRATLPNKFPYAPVVIPHWVEEIPRESDGGVHAKWRENNLGKRVIGDWRTQNKGAGLIDKYRESMPQYEFRQLDFDATNDAARQAFYRSADAYLCLSLSEGAPYSVADAEAASLPIVSTKCGNIYEFPRDDFYPITTRFHSEFGVEEAANAIRAALQNGRRSPSFYEDFTFERWQAAWRTVIGA